MESEKIEREEIDGYRWLINSWHLMMQSTRSHHPHVKKFHHKQIPPIAAYPPFAFLFCHLGLLLLLEQG